MSGSLQTHDYVPGISGMKIDLKTGKFELNGGRITPGIKLEGGVLTITHDGVVRTQITGLPDFQASEQPKAFIVVDGVTYINEAYFKTASAEDKVTAQGAVRTVLLNDKLVMVGIGLADAIKDWEPGSALKAAGIVTALFDPARSGITKDGQTEAERARDAGTMDEYFAKIIGKSGLYQSLREEIGQIASLGDINKRLDDLKEKQGAENRAVAERLDSLASRLGELHTLLTKRD